MSMKKKRQFITEVSGDHPAVRAWTSLHPNLHKPEAMELIRPMDSCKSPVFRLVGSGIDGSSVIAKRSYPSQAMIEASIYEHALGYLSKKTIHYYGHVEDDDESYWWFFTEDAGENPFSFENHMHVELAAEWLADLHTSVPKLDCLPDRGIDYYFKRLLSAYGRIMENLLNPALQESDVALLKAIVSNFELLRERWDKVHACYERFPECLVHGDFKNKNLRVRTEGSTNELLVYDWAEAGWGFPGIDVWKLDIQKYWAYVREHWCGMSLEDAKILSCLGNLFRALYAIDWKAMNLPYAEPDSYEWIEKHMTDLKAYNMRLESIFHAIALR